jgi:L-fuconolactonase
MHPSRILDGHIHLHDTARMRYRWESGMSIPQQALPTDYLAAVGNFPVEAFIFIEAAARDDQSFAEALWVSELARDGAPVAAIVAQADLRLGARVAEELDKLAAIELVRGVRWILEPPFETDPECCVRPAFIEAARLLPNYGFSLDLSVKNSALPKVLSLVSQCPDVRFILDHIGKPAIAEGRKEPWRTYIRELAAHGNVVCKISGMPVEAGAGWNADMIRPYVMDVVDAFGPDRILFGSDWPAQAAVCDFAAWTAAIIEIMSGGSADEVDRYFFRNATIAYCSAVGSPRRTSPP